ncbi:putative glucarate transporter [compost metagenome]
MVGYLVSLTGSFDAALTYVGANAVLALISYLFIVGRIQRIELNDPPAAALNAAVAAPNSTP